MKSSHASLMGRPSLYPRFAHSRSVLMAIAAYLSLVPYPYVHAETAVVILQNKQKLNYLFVKMSTVALFKHQPFATLQPILKFRSFVTNLAFEFRLSMNQSILTRIGSWPLSIWWNNTNYKIPRGGISELSFKKALRTVNFHSLITFDRHMQ